MKTWLVFEPAEGGKNSETAEKIVFLREKFSWPALFFTPLWLLWHKLWLGFVLWLVAMFVLGIAARLLGLAPNATALLLWLPSLLIAFEASELRRRKLMRKKYREAGIVVGEEIEDAEQRFFENWVQAASSETSVKTPPSAPVRNPVPSNAPLSQRGGVIGLFPEAKR